MAIKSVCLVNLLKSSTVNCIVNRSINVYSNPGITILPCKRYSTELLKGNLQVPKDIYYFHNSLSQDKQNELIDNFVVKTDFINEEEENSLLTELNFHLRRQRYQYDHWDNAIHGFKETEKLDWNEKNNSILNRVRNFAFTPDSVHLPHVHVLDLADNGYIKPHVDSVRFCGSTIAGLSLLTNSVMRLVNEGENIKFDAFLKRRSLYIMRKCVRYDFTHEILKNEESFFNDIKVEKGRRISVICRSEPPPSQDST